MLLPNLVAMKLSRVNFRRQRDNRWRLQPYRVKSTRFHWLKVVGNVLTIIISIGALIISGLSYRAQQKSSEEAAINQRDSSAQLVSTIQSDSDSLAVENLSMSQVTSVTIGAEAEFAQTSGKHPELQSLGLMAFQVSQLPPCTSVTADLSNEAAKQLIPGSNLAKGKGKGIYAFQPLFVTFTDGNGTIWKEDPFNGMAPAKITKADLNVLQRHDEGGAGVALSLKSNNCK